jgi:hypothetical protein
MYFKCNECQTVLKAKKRPFICATCGLAGVGFRAIADPRQWAKDQAAYLIDLEDEIEWDFDISPGSRSSTTVSSR